MSAATADVFLSYSRTDAPAVRQIQAYLKEAGLATFLDRDQLPVGQPWLSALERAISHCAAVVVVVGPAGLGIWQQREVQLALDRQAEAERAGNSFPVIPILLPKVEDPPVGFLRLQTWVDLRSDLADPTQLHLLLVGLRGQAPADASTLREALCPYRGLLPFREEDAGLFFGREEAIDTLRGKLRDHNVVTLVGRSGSGKSSVVFAGLIPALRRRADGRTWSILSLHPGPEPLHALVRRFDPPPIDLPPFEADQRIEQQVMILRTDDHALGRRIRSLLATAEETGTDWLLLHVDQWEELYTQALRNPALEPELAERDATQFINLLLEAARTSPCTVVLTVRADFYGEFLKHGPLAAAVPPGQVNLGPLTREGLTAAIRKPAQAVGLTVDPPLLETLVDEVCNDLGKLPLLEYALKETWRRREGQRLTLNAYGQAGGIDGAVAQRANQIFTSLSQAQQAAARRLFVSLVTPGEGREDTRARAVYPEQDDAIAAVIDKFSAADARLLVTGEDAPSARRLVDLSHEAMIREWDLLKTWIEINREALRRREHIRARLRQWEEQGRDPTLLLPPGLPLEEGRKLLADHGDVLIDEVQPYIEASAVAAKAEEDAARRAQRRRRAMTTGLTFIVLLSLVSSLFYLWYGNRESRFLQAWNLRERGISALARNDPATAELAFAKALAIDDRPDTRQFLITARAKSPQVVWTGPLRQDASTTAISPRGRFAILKTWEGSELWDLQARLRLYVFPTTDEMTLASFSGDEHMLAIATNHVVELWALYKQPQKMDFRNAEDDQITGLALSYNGKSLALSKKDRTICTLNLELQGQAIFCPFAGHRDWVDSLAFSPDGRFLVSGGRDNNVKVWDAMTAHAIHTLIGPRDAVLSVALSPDGRLVAAGGWDNRIWLWETTSGKQGRLFKGHQGGVKSLAFSPNGKLLASGSEDGTARLWDVESGNHILTLRGTGTEVDAIAFNSYGGHLYLVIGDSHGFLRIWDLDSIGQRNELMTFRGHEKAVSAATFRTNASLIISGSWDHTIRLWDINKTQLPQVLNNHQDSITALRVSADGKWLASASKDSTVRIWDFSAAQIHVLKHNDDYGGSTIVRDIAFDGSGQLLASAADDKRIRIWNVADGSLIRVCTAPAAAYAIAFSPDGVFLASASTDGAITIFQAGNCSKFREIRSGHTSSIWQIIFHPNGRYLISASEDGTARFWDFWSGKMIGNVIKREGPIWSADLSADGQMLAIGNQDATVELWHIEFKDSDVRVNKDLVVGVCDGPVWSVAFGKELRSQSLGIACEDDTLRLWNPNAFRNLIGDAAKLEADGEQQTGSRISQEDGTISLVTGFVPQGDRRW